MSLSNPQSPIPNPIPNHIGIILDGNRRWAVENGRKTLDGHKRGSEVFKEISLGLFERGVKYVSAFVFSTENWQRKAEEIDYLMRLVVKAVELHLDEYDKKNICIKILGKRDNLHAKVLKAIERTEAKTANNTGGTLALCFNYGGRQEIVDAVKRIVASGVSELEVSEDLITNQVYSSDIPDVDLLVRTSSEKRTSGFMLWRAWYAELAFIEKYWPDIVLSDFDTVLDEYSKRQRRFGV